MKFKRLYGIKCLIGQTDNQINMWWADIYQSKNNPKVFWLGGSPSLVFNLWENRVERDNAFKRLKTQIKHGWLDGSSAYKKMGQLKKVTYYLKAGVE